jgi:peptide/nickel transport system permease protein
MSYVQRRVGFALVTVFIAVTLNFFLFRVMPGTAVTGLRCQNCSAQFKAAIAREYGLDKPKIVQYGIYLGDLARGDLGTSVYNNQPVWDDISGPLLNTLPMIIAGTVISIVLGVASGVVSAWRRGTATDVGSLWTSLACYAMPTQWIGLLVVFYVATAVGLPRAGISTATLGILGPPSSWAVLVDRTRHLIVAGAIVVEDVFSYPGIGLATVDAIDRRDYPVLEGIFLLLTVAVIVCNLIADLLYFRLDPRLRRELAAGPR